MATEIDITEYHKGEFIEIQFLAKNRDGTALTNPASQTVTMTIGDTSEGIPSLVFTTGSGDIVLNDAPTASFLISLSAADLTSLVEGRTYYYNLWVGSTERTLQAKGKFTLQKSIEP